MAYPVIPLRYKGINMASRPRNEKKRQKTTANKPNEMILRRTLVLMAVCGVVAFLVLAIKLYSIQIRDHDRYERLAVEQQTRESTVNADRGTIADTNGKVLAISASAETVFISPYEINLYNESKELIASNLAALLNVDKTAILSKMQDTNSQYKTIKQKIESDVSEKVRKFIKDNNIKSVHLEPDSKRYYPFSSLACHVLGFVGTDNTGLEGLERQYNSFLKGTNGRIVRLKNAKGTDMLFSDFENYQDAKNGDDITLTIDSTIQFYVEKYLAQAIKDYDVQNGGACIVMQPKTGAVLAMASYGNYDLNNFQAVSSDVQAKIDAMTDTTEKQNTLKNAQLQQWRNKTLSDTYEPGSVFKIITCAMALEENIVNLNSKFTCKGSIDVLGRDDPVNCWKTAGHGEQTLVQAMQHSCNVALVNIGLDVGASTFYKYIDAFGLFDKTGIDLPGEGGSIWWDKKTFYDNKNFSQLAVASFGQTFKITPMQMVTAVSAAVNGGNLMKPYIVKDITNSDGKVVQANAPTLVRQVISEQTSKTMRDILEQVVGGTEGTGKNAAVAGYKIGGKTGTSEKVAEDNANKEKPKQYIVSFCGVAPTDDPQVVILLLLDNPSSKTNIFISGGNMAAPVVGHIFSDILPYLGIQPVYSGEEKSELDVTVPKLVGLSLEEATERLEAMGLTVKKVGDGAGITDQLPAANITVAPGSQVILYAGGTKPTDMVIVPNLTGKTFKEAKKTLESQGLFIKTGGILTNNADAVVSTQTVEMNEQVTAGTVIKVTLVDKSIQGHY